jgi:hypothetical protein
MKILFRANFRQKNFRKKLAENLLGSGSGSGTGSGQKSSGSATLRYEKFYALKDDQTQNNTALYNNRLSPLLKNYYTKPSIF